MAIIYVALTELSVTPLQQARPGQATGNDLAAVLLPRLP
jgi:hypothetical protein